MTENDPNLVGGQATEVRGDDLEVRVAGAKFTGWKEVTVTRSLAAASGAFRLTTVRRFDERWPIRPLDPVQITVGDETLLTGFVEDLEDDVSPDSSAISVAGRSKTMDLVDSSATGPPTEWNGLDLLELAERLAAPFGVDVVADLGSSSIGANFATFRVDPQETAFGAIARAARMRGLLVTTNGEGELLITKAGRNFTNVDLVEGENIFKRKVRWTLASRFRTYIVKGQAPGDDGGFGETVAAISASAEDLEIDRPRATVVLAPGRVSPGDAQALAEWEASNRRARSLFVSCEVPGWRQELGGPVWAPNTKVEVRIPTAGIRGTMLTQEVVLARGPESAAVTRMTLVLPDVYDRKPEIPEGASNFDELFDGTEIE